MERIDSKLLEFLKDKSIIILGFGKKGKSSYSYIRKNFPDKKIQIVDENELLLDQNEFLKEDQNLEINIGKDYFKDIDKYDIIIKTPGITLKNYNVEGFRHKIYSQLELLLEYIPCYTIGITGTKGKSTTSSLMYKVLKDNKKDVLLLGNIGEPYFDNFDKMKEDTILVLEISSHSLEFVRRSPKIGILLDIFQEHLDHHNKIEEYIGAKFNIGKYQEEKDYFIYNSQNNYMNSFMMENNIKPKENDIAVCGRFDLMDDKGEKVKEEIKNNKYKNYIYIENDKIYLNDKEIYSKKITPNIKGEHNIINSLFVIAVSSILELDIEKAVKSIETLAPLPHRIELVGKVDGIEFYNDSIATIPEATIEAIKALKNINTLLLGGLDRGVNLDILYEFLRKSDIENIICMPKTGDFIYEHLKDTNKKLYKVENLEEAVKKAKEITKKETICLLSPAAASYGYFKNFEERGEKFKEYVLNG